MELAAGGVEGVLLLLGDSGPDQRTAVVVEELAQKGLGAMPPQVGVVVTTADQLATQHPEVIAMALQGFPRPASKPATGYSTVSRRRSPARELTKKFESIVTLPFAAKLAAKITGRTKAELYQMTLARK